MSTQRKNGISRVQGFLFAGLGACAIALAGCSGDEGPKDTSTPPDPVFPPGPGSGAAIPLTSAKTIVASITRVTMQDDSKAAVEVYLRDQDNFSLKGLPAANIRFVLARLEPAANGASSTWHAITRRTEAFPGTAPTPPDKVTGTGPTNQATTETATAGVWTDKHLVLFDGGEFELEGANTLTPEGGATRVVWRAAGEAGNNPVNRYFALLLSRWIGEDFAQSLAQLKALLEPKR